MYIFHDNYFERFSINKKFDKISTRTGVSITMKYLAVELSALFFKVIYQLFL